MHLLVFTYIFIYGFLSYVWTALYFVALELNKLSKIGKVLVLIVRYHLFNYFIHILIQECTKHGGSGLLDN
jgi:hypothetical protein